MDQRLGTALSRLRRNCRSVLHRRGIALVLLALCSLPLALPAGAQQRLAQSTPDTGAVGLSQSKCDQVRRDYSESSARTCWNLVTICKPSETERIADTDSCFEMLSNCESYMNRHFEWRAECQDLVRQCLPDGPGKQHNGRRCRRLLNRCGTLLERRAAAEKRCLSTAEKAASKSKRSSRLRRFRLQSDLIKVRAWCASVWPNDANQQAQCVTQQLKDLQRLRSTIR